MSPSLFHSFGFLICLGSTAGHALKSVVQGLLITSDAEKLNSMNFLIYMAPMATALLLPITVWMEGDITCLTVEKVGNDHRQGLLLLGNATVDYLVNLTNFLVTRAPSLSRCFGMGIAGFGITIMGFILYNEAKKRSKNSSSSSSPSS